MINSYQPTIHGFPEELVNSVATAILATDDGIYDCFGDIAVELQIKGLQEGVGQREVHNALMDEAIRYAVADLQRGSDTYEVGLPVPDAELDVYEAA